MTMFISMKDQILIDLKMDIIWYFQMKNQITNLYKGQISRPLNPEKIGNETLMEWIKMVWHDMIRPNEVKHDHIAIQDENVTLVNMLGHPSA